ncbi:MAG: hypothetical protein EAX86_05740 [Candidatus Heimdallarchaeota archaeon]|nr:hypothetical protein [Candidatus Heimdallarchaeota archaeon]
MLLGNFIRDPEWINYETLFFLLTLGKYDSIFTFNSDNIFIQEFSIFIENIKSKLDHIEEIIKQEISKFIQKTHQYSTASETMHIEFLHYVSLLDGSFLGLGLRMSTDDKLMRLSFGYTPESRLERAMFLLSRGILQSNYHSISQIEYSLPIKV